jgi:hypothetical protein
MKLGLGYQHMVTHWLCLIYLANGGATRYSEMKESFRLKPSMVQVTSLSRFLGSNIGKDTNALSNPDTK